MGNELSSQTETDSIGTVDLVGRLREAVDAAKARRAHERDHEVEDTKGMTWHQTGPDEAHERFRCDVTKCGWQPAGEQHTGTLNLTGEGNPERSPISDELVSAAAEHMHSVEQTYFGPSSYAPHIAEMLARAALEAAYPAIRQHVAEQIAAELDKVADSLKRSADDDRQRSIDAGGRATYEGDRLMRLAVNRNNRAGGFRDAAYLTRDIGTSEIGGGQ